jgi:eukaryotic-like serine/threonine-protein kinase
VAGSALWKNEAAPGQATRFQVPPPDNVTMGEYISLSPDGRKLVYNTTGQQSGLWVRSLDTVEPRLLPGTEGARSPFWSPDSRFIGFGVGNDLKKIEASGGPPQTLCTSPNQVGSRTWNRDGVIVFGARGAGPMRSVPEAGGMARDLTFVDAPRGENYHSFPTFLPDGKHFLFLRQGRADINGTYAGSLDANPS